MVFCQPSAPARLIAQSLEKQIGQNKIAPEHLARDAYVYVFGPCPPLSVPGGRQ